MIEAVLFDYGGVVLHEDPADYDRIGGRHGFPPGILWTLAHSIPEYLPSRIGQLSAEEFLDAMRRHLAGFAPAGRVDATLAAIAAHYADQPPVRPEMRIVLEALRPRVRLGLLSNATRGSTARLQANGVGDLFDVLLCSGDIGLAKPDPAAFALALERLGVRAERCLFVDDVAENVRVAQRLGLLATHYHHARHGDFLALLARHGLALPRPRLASVRGEPPAGPR